MPRRLSFTRLSLFEQPLVFIASSFTFGLLFAARFRFSTRVWLIAPAVLWTAASICLLRKLGGRAATCLLLALGFSCGGASWATYEAGCDKARVMRLDGSG